jgi:hypothetical protein
MVRPMSLAVGTWGYNPPQLVPEHLVSAEQRRLELVQVVQLIADQWEQASDSLTGSRAVKSNIV